MPESTISNEPQNGMREGQVEVTMKGVTGSNDDEVKRLQQMVHQVVVLRNISRLFASTEEDLERVLFALIHMIPEGFRYPEDVEIRAEVDHHAVQTEKYKNTPWSLSVAVKSGRTSKGTITVAYPDKPPEGSDEPFTESEQDFVGTIASELGIFLERFHLRRVEKQHKQELEIYASLLRHDLRNDLGVILAHIDLARLINTDDRLLETISAIEAACNRMLNILSAFGSMSSVAESDIVKIIEGSAAQARNAETNMTINVEIEPMVRTVRIPESRLLPMVFDNLLRNAATHAGQATTVNISARLEDDRIRVVVTDDGPGVPPEIRDRLFRKGVSTKGGGMGLYLSREILSSIDGSIQLLDTDRGAAFEIEIPIISRHS